MRRAIRPLGITALEIAAFAIAAVVMTWPLVLHIPNGVANLGDPLIASWAFAWVVHAIKTDPLQLFNANIFYPEVGTLAYADHVLAVLPISAPAWWASGNAVLVHNVIVLTVVTLGGWSAYRLALDVTGLRGPAAVCGVIVGFSPFVVSHLAQVQQLAAYTLPFAWLFGRRVVRDARGRDAVGFGAAWSVAILSSWYQAAFLSISLVALLGAEVLVRRRRIAWRRVALLLGAPTMVVAAVAFVMSRPYAAVQERYPQAARSVGEAEIYSVTPRSVLAAPPGNVLYGGITTRFRPLGFTERTMFVGIVPAVLLGASVVGAFRRRKPAEVAPWLAAGGSMLALALGPFMRIGSLRVPLPFLALYVLLPPLRFLRVPGRAFGLMMLAVGVLAAIALARVERPRLRAAASAAAVVLIGIEYASVPMSLVEAPRPSPAYRYLAASKVPGAVLELPTVPVVDGQPVPGAEVGETRYAYLSTMHWRPILNGYSGFFPPTHAEMVRTVQDFPSPRSLAFLRARDVAFVAVHLDLLPGSPWADLAGGVRDPALELVADDGQVRVYRLRGARSPRPLRADTGSMRSASNGALALVTAVGVVGLAVLSASREARSDARVESTYSLPGPPPSWSLDGSRVAGSSPVIADLDPGQANGPEIAVGANDGRLYVLRVVDGQLRLVWSSDIGSVIDSSPSVADLNGDGRNEILVGALSTGGTRAPGVHVFAHDGSNHRYWPTPDVSGFANGVFSTPAVGNVSGDARPEIVFGAFNHHMYVKDAAGNDAPGWAGGKFMYDTVWSSPALADVNGDGDLEIVIGSDLGGGAAVFGCPKAARGMVSMFDGDGSFLPGWPKCMDTPIWSSPAVQDVNGDGVLDVIVGTNNYRENEVNVGETWRVHSWSADGTALWSTPLKANARIMSSPAVGDVTGDGRLEVAVGTIDDNVAGRVWVLDARTGRVLWSDSDGDDDTCCIFMGSPVLADVSGDGRPDVIQAGGDGAVHAWHGTGEKIFRDALGLMIFNAPAVGDVDADGLSEIVAASAGLGNESKTGKVWVLGTPGRGAGPWPMFRHDAARLGAVGVGKLAAPGISPAKPAPVKRSAKPAPTVAPVVTPTPTEQPTAEPDQPKVVASMPTDDDDDSSAVRWAALSAVLTSGTAVAGLRVFLRRRRHFL